MSSKTRKPGRPAHIPARSRQKLAAMDTIANAAIPAGGRLAARFAALGAVFARRRPQPKRPEARRWALYPDTH